MADEGFAVCFFLAIAFEGPQHAVPREIAWLSAATRLPQTCVGGSRSAGILPAYFPSVWLRGAAEKSLSGQP